MCHVHPLLGDVMLTSIKSCHSQTKINVSLKFCIKNITATDATVNLFVNFLKNWNRRGLDHLIKKTDESDSIARKSGSGRVDYELQICNVLYYHYILSRMLLAL